MTRVIRFGTGLLTIIGFSIPAVMAAGGTIYVDVTNYGDPQADGTPGHPFCTIQEGIGVANHGTTVLVADGTYTGPGNVDLDFGGKLITVRSENGPGNCTIDCEHTGRGFHFHNGETSLAVLDGFTITNGSAANGGGVLCEASDPTVTNCTIVANAATLGGGVCCTSSSSPTITSCTIDQNTAARGGGVYCEDNSSPTIADCKITYNVVRDDGGGIYCLNSSSPTIAGCDISDNRSNSTVYTACGGGIFCHTNSNLAMTDCTIQRNAIYTHYHSRGAGIYCHQSDIALTGCAIVANAIHLTKTRSSSAYGGGVMCNDNASLALTNCLIAQNAAGIGGGINCWSTTVTILNCTIADNAASVTGGGVLCNACVDVTICNSVLWGDSAPTGPEIALTDHTTLSVSYSDVRLGAGGVSVSGGSTLDWGAGNIDANPLFVDPGIDDYSLWGDPSIPMCSPCIDAGNNECVPLDITKDIVGSPRFVDYPTITDTGYGTPPIVDMGAYEFGIGDLNCDGEVNLFDIDPFVLALTSAGNPDPFDDYYAVWPNCDPMLADINADGTVDLFDVDLFVGLLTGD